LVYLASWRDESYWVATASFRGFGCSECGWVFTVSGPLVGDTIEEMKRAFERERDEAFKACVCQTSEGKLAHLCDNDTADRTRSLSSHRPLCVSFRTSPRVDTLEAGTFHVALPWRDG
jgi:hypothetical protein